MTCATCRWWDKRYPEERRGECRIAPPRPVTDMYSHIRARFPITDDTDWCGEYESEEAVMRAAEKCL